MLVAHQNRQLLELWFKSKYFNDCFTEPLWKKLTTGLLMIKHVYVPSIFLYHEMLSSDKGVEWEKKGYTG